MEEEKSEVKILDVDRIYDLLNFYKLPLILIFLSLFLIGAGVLSWQSSQKAAKITFSSAGESGAAEIASASAKIKADLEGAVVKPGIYELSSGSRISDLLVSAGGLTQDADREWMTKNLNQAAKVLDGGKIYIPKLGEMGEVGKLGGLGSEKIMGKISLNSASLAELESLPGVGPVTAQKIIDGRPYQTIEELLQKKIVGKSVFEKIKDKIGL